MTPRTTLFNFDEVECPIPLEFMDVTRVTETDLSDLSEARIEDHWTQDYIAGGDPPLKELSFSWKGRTTFMVLKPCPPLGFVLPHKYGAPKYPGSISHFENARAVYRG